MTAAPRFRTSTYRVEELVAMVLAGTVRIPEFRFGFRWTATDVVALFESIYLGFPIGALLFQRKPAAARMYSVGPLQILGPEIDDALWVIDGQHRLVSIAVALGRPTPIPTTPTDPWVVYFDPATQRFCSPPSAGVSADTWVPVTVMRSAHGFLDWARDWPYAHEPELFEAVNEARVRLREYVVPASTLETNDPAVLQETFARVNAAGKRQNITEIVDALASSNKPEAVTRLDEMADALTTMGMGRPDERELMRWVVARGGLDATKRIDDILWKTALFLVDAAALPTLRRVFGFLSTHCGIPHLRLLPYSAPLMTLMRFFHVHPNPKARSRELLIRWLWRGMLVMCGTDERVFQQQARVDIDDDEEGSVQRMLGTLPKHASPLQMPECFDARAAKSRLTMLGLCALVPRDLVSGRPLDIPAILELGIWRRIVGEGSAVAKSPANRTLLPGTGLARDELLAAADTDEAEVILESHAITHEAIQALGAGDDERFLNLRAQTLEVQANAHAAAMADWQGNDRPSLDYVIHQLAGAVAHDEGV